MFESQEKMSLGTSSRNGSNKQGCTRSSSTFVIIPKSFCGVFYYHRVAEAWPVVVEKGKLVCWQDVCGLLVELGPNFR